MKLSIMILMLTAMQNISPTCSQRSILDFDIGEPKELFTDIPGEPLGIEDFRNALNIAGENVEVDPAVSSRYFQGDIIIDSYSDLDHFKNPWENSPGRVRNAIVDYNKRWTNGTIPYLISSMYDTQQRAYIAAAVMAIHNHTCLRFVPRTDQKDYIHLLNGYECSSRVGRKGGPQSISLAPKCLSLGVILHEFMHAIGFWHEHSRWDRDKFINILWDNVSIGKSHNFDRLGVSEAQTLNVDYDYASLLHYGPYAFTSTSNKPTIIPKRLAEIGQRRRLSEMDIYKMNILYECKTKLANTGDCIDSNTNCWIWELLGECKNNPQWMNFNCKTSCGICGMKRNCLDRHSYCKKWATKGECIKNSKYMTIYCTESCNKC